MPEQTYEDYSADGNSDLAQRLHDEGLIYAINRLILHPLGLALGARGTAITGGKRLTDITGLCLWHTTDPDGWRYDNPNDVRDRALAKLELAGHTELAQRLRADTNDTPPT